METSPDKYCKLTVTNDYLEEALTQIHQNGSSVIAVTPKRFDIITMDRYEVTSYMIIYYNPPAQAPFVPPGPDGAPAIIQ